MKSTLTYVALAVLALGAVFAGWQLRGCQSGENVRAQTSAAQTDTVYAERQITRRDTVTVTKPVERTIYETRTDTVRDCFTRPTDFDVQGLTTDRPLKVEGGGVFSDPSVTLTTFNPRASRFEQAEYSVPEEHWELYPYAATGWGPLGFRAGAGVGLRWRRIELHAGYRLAEGGRRGVAFGVRVRPFTLDW